MISSNISVFLDKITKKICVFLDKITKKICVNQIKSLILRLKTNIHFQKWDGFSSANYIIGFSNGSRFRRARPLS